MKQLERTITIHAPAQGVYNQLTHFEDFAKFMPRQVSVQQLDDRRAAWKTSFLGVKLKWRTVIEDWVDGRSVTWRGSVAHPQNGAITLEAIDANTTRMTVNLEYQSRGWLEKALDGLGVVTSHVTDALERFKAFVEATALHHAAMNRCALQPVAAECWSMY